MAPESPYCLLRAPGRLYCLLVPPGSLKYLMVAPTASRWTLVASTASLLPLVAFTASWWPLVTSLASQWPLVAFTASWWVLMASIPPGGPWLNSKDNPVYTSSWCFFFFNSQLLPVSYNLYSSIKGNWKNKKEYYIVSFSYENLLLKRKKNIILSSLIHFKQFDQICANTKY